MQIIRTSQFNKAFKKLVQQHKIDVINDLNNIIDDLTKFKISTQKSNHRLVNQKNVNDIHIRPNIILLYRYDSGNNLIISLELINIVNHDQLNKKLNKIKGR